MKNKTLIITNIIVLSCIAIGLLIFMFWGIGTNHHFFNIKNELLYTETYNINEISKIKTELKSYDIEFKENNNNEVKIEVYGNEKNKENIDAKIKNETLNIEQKGSSICFGFCYSDNLIIIYMPKENNLGLDINTVSGDIDILVDVSNDISLKSISGDIKTKNLKDASLNTTSGDINVEKVRNASLNTVSGDIKVNEASNIDAKSTSGDITILEVTNKLSIKSTSGDVTVRDFTINSDSKVNTVSGEVNINLTNNANINAETRSGDKDIKNSNGEFNLDIKTTSGDITVM